MNCKLPRLRLLLVVVIQICAHTSLPIMAQQPQSARGIDTPGAAAKAQATILELGKQLDSPDTDAIDKRQILSTITDIYSKTLNWVGATPFYERLANLDVTSGDVEGAAAVFASLALLYRAHDDGIRAAAAYEREAELEAQAGDRISEAQALVEEGLAVEGADWQKAVLAYERVPSVCDALVESGCPAVLALDASGRVYANHSNLQSAVIAYEKSIALATKLADLDGKAEALDDLATVYDDTGEWEKAVASLRSEALVRHEAGSPQSEGLALNRIDPIYVLHGEWRKAVESDQQAASAFAVGDNLEEEATALISAGTLYGSRGFSAQALEIYQKALDISRQAGSLTAEAVILNNMAFGYLDTNKEKALDYFRLALPVYRQLIVRDGQSGNLGRGWLGEEARIIGNICYTLDELGLHKDALDQCSHAFQIYDELGLSDRAEMVIQMGNVYEELGESNMALDYFQRALPIVMEIDQNLEVRAYTSLMKHYSTRQPALAVLYGKEAVKRLQLARGHIVPDKEASEKFVVDFGGTYTYLADLLIRLGRLSEAQQVLNLLKDREYKDYIRAETTETLTHLALTPAERSAEEDYKRSTAKRVEQRRRLSELKQNKARALGEYREFQQLSDSVGKESQLMNDYFARINKLFGEGAVANRQVAKITGEPASLKRQIAKMPHTVAIYTVVSNNHYSVIVITGSTMVAHRYDISEKDLHQRVAALRQIILDPSKDPKPLAYELYKILIAPIKEDLDQAGAQTLVWSLDGVLRYVPFAALYDGQHYLVENYSLASFTPVIIGRLSDKPNLTAVSAAGMGVSAQFDDKLVPLPKVESELESIIRDPRMSASTGVMAGTILLNAEFTKPAMEQQLDGEHSVVHIASHFVVRPGDDNQSYLLLASKDGGNAGYHMTVAEFRENQKMALDGTELLTLSACDTGVGGASANGREVDGLAITAQRKGAKAVMSSLWRLNDNSTADLMSDFYKRWVDGGGRATKAEALRQAQLDLLLGKVTAKPDKNDPDAGTSYSQPYYWAPFVLMGNWQ